MGASGGWAPLKLWLGSPAPVSLPRPSLCWGSCGSCGWDSAGWARLPLLSLPRLLSLSLSSGLEPHSQAQLLPGQGRVTTHCQGGWVQSPANSPWWVPASRTRGAPWCLLPALLAGSLSFCWPALLKGAQDHGERMVEVSWSWPRAGGEGRGELHWVWGRQSCHLAT